MFQQHFKTHMVFSKALQPCLREVIFTSLPCNRLTPRETPAPLRNFCKYAEIDSPSHRKELPKGGLHPMGWELLLHQSWQKTKGGFEWGDLFSVSQLTTAESLSLLTRLNAVMLPADCSGQTDFMKNRLPAHSEGVFRVLHQASYEVFQHQAEPWQREEWSDY